MKIGKTEFDFSKRTGIMGVLNLTPDSFSDGGQFLDPSKALDRALQMEAEGADVIDIGGESTRPGSDPVSEKGETERLLPALKKLIPVLKIPISLDTQKAAVARIGIEEGISMINDISALTGDTKMAEVVARAKVPVILMHKKGRPKTMQENVHYKDLMGEVTAFLADRVRTATDAGIARDRILLDPGIGFGKSVADNLELIQRLPEIVKLGFPVIVGASRKSFIGKILSKASSLPKVR